MVKPYGIGYGHAEREASKQTARREAAALLVPRLKAEGYKIPATRGAQYGDSGNIYVVEGKHEVYLQLKIGDTGQKWVSVGGYRGEKFFFNRKSGWPIDAIINAVKQRFAYDRAERARKAEVERLRKIREQQLYADLGPVLTDAKLHRDNFNNTELEFESGLDVGFSEDVTEPNAFYFHARGLTYEQVVQLCVRYREEFGAVTPTSRIGDEEA